MTAIHPSAVVDTQARLADDVSIGPFCVVGPEVTLEEGVRLESHVVITGRSHLGPRCRVYPFATIGTPPQDLKYMGEASEIRIGAETVVREQATLHTGTHGGGMCTRIGARCLLMAGTHVAHDCKVGDDVIMANNAALAGHVQVGEGAVLGGFVGVHQFVRIGGGAMIGLMTGVDADVVPYGLVKGNRGCLEGLNLVGLKRRGVEKSAIQALRTAYRRLFEADRATFQTRLDAVARDFQGDRLVEDMLAFIRADTSRPLCHPGPGCDG